MSREEAIEILKQFKKCLSDVVFDEKGSEAWQMAIQALSQEPCEDTVSIRKDVLKCRVGELVAYNVEWLKEHWQMEMDIVCGVKPCDDAISRILKRMWNCRGKHTTSIDKVKMEQIIRDELPSVTTKSIECDDAVSREAVIEWIEELKKSPWATNKRGIGFEYLIAETLDVVEDLCVKRLPSVTQKGDVKNV